MYLKVVLIFFLMTKDNEQLFFLEAGSHCVVYL